MLDHRTGLFKVMLVLLLFLYRYEVITGCWNESPDKRPSFEDLSQAINSLLEGVAGYMDFSAFSNESARAGASGYDHLAGVGSGYNHLEPLENVDSQLYDKVEPD